MPAVLGAIAIHDEGLCAARPTIAIAEKPRCLVHRVVLVWATARGSGMGDGHVHPRHPGKQVLHVWIHGGVHLLVHSLRGFHCISQVDRLLQKHQNALAGFEKGGGEDLAIQM
jgi:hypothetical protein